MLHRTGLRNACYGLGVIILGAAIAATALRNNDPRYGGHWGKMILFGVSLAFFAVGWIASKGWTFPLRWVGFHHTPRSAHPVVGAQDSELTKAEKAKKVEWLIGVAHRVSGELEANRLLINEAIKSGYLWDETFLSLQDHEFQSEKTSLSEEPQLREAYSDLVAAYHEVARINAWNRSATSIEPEVRDGLRLPEALRTMATARSHVDSIAERLSQLT